MSIVQFENHFTKLQKELEKTAATLTSCHARIDEAIEAVMELEDIMMPLEEEYNYKLFQVAKKVGIENVSKDHLDLATSLAYAAGSFWLVNPKDLNDRIEIGEYA